MSQSSEEGDGLDAGASGVIAPTEGGLKPVAKGRGRAARGGSQTPQQGACSRPRGSPGQHARLWVSRCRLLKRRSSIVGGRSIFSNLQHPPGEQDDPRCAGSGGRTQGCRRLFWAGINMVLVA